MENSKAISLDGADQEKQTIEYAHIDTANGSMDNTAAETGRQHDLSPRQQRKIIRHIDRRLVVTIGVLYCISLMDRTNMSAANIAGMRIELKLHGTQYNIANLVFFVPYIIFQAPSTVLIRRIGPRLHLSVITLLWGAVMIGMGFVGSFGQLAGLRALLGLLEAGFFPSCVYLLSTWYTRYEVGKRYSLFYLFGCLISAFSGILAYGLMHLGGQAGITGWRWIFIVEGAITCGMAIVGYWLLVDFPESQRKTWGFLKPHEHQWIINRIQKDRGDSRTPPFNLRKFLSAGKDWKVWAYAMICFNTLTLSYALAYTLPILLVGNMGFSIGAAQCLIAPPFVFASIIMLLGGYLGDKYHVRGPIILFNMLLCLIGLPIMGWHPKATVRYFGVFLVAAGANSNVPATLSFQANNVRGQWKRAFCSATLVGFGGVGGIAGSLVFRDQDQLTGYKPGFYACITCCLLTVILVVLCDLDFHRQNKLADQGKKNLECQNEEASDGFRYTY